MVLGAASLQRKIQIQRFSKTGTDEFNEPVGDWENLGVPISASRKDVSDAERQSAGTWANVLVTRFVIRSTAFGRSIVRTDRLVHEGVTYGIDGIKEVPSRRAFLEITAVSLETK